MNTLKSASLLALLTSTSPAFAVGGTATVLSGLLHPILGFDHLVAMIAVGLLSIQLGGKHIWGLPACFVAVLFLGAMLGIAGMPLPQVEGIISISVVILGLAIASQARIGVWIAYPIVAVFAMFHGHAHGGEIPSLGNPTSYIIGFLLASALLHVLGIGIGKIARTSRTRALIGAICTGLGVHMVLLIYGLV